MVNIEYDEIDDDQRAVCDGCDWTGPWDWDTGAVSLDADRHAASCENG